MSEKKSCNLHPNVAETFHAIIVISLISIPLQPESKLLPPAANSLLDSTSYVLFVLTTLCSRPTHSLP